MEVSSMGNTWKTTLLLGALTVLIVLIGRVFGGQKGMILAFFLAMAMNAVSYWYSDKIVLRMVRAREATSREYPQLYEIVRDLSAQADIPVPRIFVIPEKSPNAFATGRNPEHAVVAVTQGLLELMSRDEVAGVLAHEIGHIKNRDILIGTVAATLAGAVMILATMARWTAFLGGGSSDDEGGGLGAVGLIVMSILAPIAAMLIQMAISRSREYQADATGGRLIGRPEALASALEKLGAYSKRLPLQQARPDTAHMFIVNPLRGGGISRLFSTHPPLEDRIARLRGLHTESSGRPASDRASGRDRARDTWRSLSG
jgi:heat shock protein HtpX